jgi:hypothetical protein
MKTAEYLGFRSHLIILVGAAFPPLFMIVRNWRALKYSKKRLFNAEK